MRRVGENEPLPLSQTSTKYVHRSCMSVQSPMVSWSKLTAVLYFYFCLFYSIAILLYGSISQFYGELCQKVRLLTLFELLLEKAKLLNGSGVKRLMKLEPKSCCPIYTLQFASAIDLFRSIHL